MKKMNTFAVCLCLLAACSNEPGPEPIRLNAPDFVSGFPNLDEKLAEGALTFDLTHVDKVTFHIDDTHRWLKPSDTLIRPLRVLVHDGKIAVVQSTRVHFYDDDGNHLKMIGQHGKGPGEFDVITSVGLNGDKLMIYDSNMRRFTTIGSEYESQTVARYAPANERNRSILFAGLNEYVLESQRLDSTRLGVTDITCEEVLIPIAFPMPVPFGYDPQVFNSAYISLNLSPSGDFAAGYNMIPVLFRFGSDYTLRKIYYLDILSDPDMEFPQKLLGIRNRALNPRPVLFDQVHFLSESRFILRYRSLLYVLDEDAMDTNVLAIEMLNPRRPDEPMFIRDFHIQDNYLYVIDSYHDYVYRFDIGEYL